MRRRRPGKEEEPLKQEEKLDGDDENLASIKLSLPHVQIERARAVSGKMQRINEILQPDLYAELESLSSSVFDSVAAFRHDYVHQAPEHLRFTRAYLLAKMDYEASSLRYPLRVVRPTRPRPPCISST